MLEGKKIIVAVSASIAAYKSAILVRLLKKQRAEVKVIMTASASSFITPLTLSTLSENPVLIDFAKDKTGEWNNHVDLGLWADAMLIAPATANTLGKAANGICDNLLLATYLSARCPVFWSPAMDLDMYQHASVQQNLATLEKVGNHIIAAESGELASGLVGQGRMAEPEHIVELLLAHFSPTKTALYGKKVLITAGPTQEYIDPVRYITNQSTGKMGYAIANELGKRGCEVTLISGPSSETPPTNVKLVKVLSSQNMFDAVNSHFPKTDVSIFSAAVADYTPLEKSAIKIKKNDSRMRIGMVKTKDIAKEMGVLKSAKQINVGFALETNDELQNAKGKLDRKNFDMIVLNSLNDKGAGFGHDTNVITIIDKDSQQKYPLKSKIAVAVDIVNHLEKLVG